MFVIHLCLTGTTSPPSPADAHSVQDLLWAHADPRHRLEHVVARCVPDGIGLVLYISANTAERATEQAANLLAGVRTAGVLAHYTFPASG
ncbi:hypothetical protein AB0M42_26300 [Streptomyces sp. NPDC051784]|uniref:hypothetical protein n=1 Tax=Streptomyces sp. NPDC051784 TaxID=3155805 RepID=UPI00341D082F